MFSWFSQTIASSIDQLTWNHAHRTSQEPELEQLSKLFDSKYLRKLHKAMIAGIAQNHPNGALCIKLAWIDKIPLADSTTLTNKTELGDAILFAIEEVAGAKPRKVLNARAVLLQAKVTTAKRQKARPRVPINAMTGSTAQEFLLLSSWPQFDLYKTSGSATPLVAGIDLASSNQAPHPYGWYLAAPRGNNIAAQVQSIWPSWWMAGPPIRGDGCTNTFGTFLRAFLQGQQLQTSGGALEVGKAFNCSAYPPHPANLTGWDRVCAEIIDIVENNPAPNYLFGNTTERIWELDDVPLQFLSFGPCPPQVHVPTPCRVQIGKVRFRAPVPILNRLFWSRSYPDIPVPPRGTGDEQQRPGGKRIPVLIFNSYISDRKG